MHAACPAHVLLLHFIDIILFHKPWRLSQNILHPLVDPHFFYFWVFPHSDTDFSVRALFRKSPNPQTYRRSTREQISHIYRRICEELTVRQDTNFMSCTSDCRLNASSFCARCLRVVTSPVPNLPANSYWFTKYGPSAGPVPWPRSLTQETWLANIAGGTVRTDRDIKQVLAIAPVAAAVCYKACLLVRNTLIARL